MVLPPSHQQARLAQHIRVQSQGLVWMMSFSSVCSASQHILIVPKCQCTNFHRTQFQLFNIFMLLMVHILFSFSWFHLNCSSAVSGSAL